MLRNFVWQVRSGKLRLKPSSRRCHERYSFVYGKSKAKLGCKVNALPALAVVQTQNKEDRRGEPKPNYMYVCTSSRDRMRMRWCVAATTQRYSTAQQCSVCCLPQETGEAIVKDQYRLPGGQHLSDSLVEIQM